MIPSGARLAALALLLALGAGMSAQEGWLFFRGDAAYEAAYQGDILRGRTPSLVFPLFGSELEGDGSALGWRQDYRGFSLSLAAPTFYYDVPFSSPAEISSPPSPTLPELQRAMQDLPDPLHMDLAFMPDPSFSVKSDIEFAYRRDSLLGERSTFDWMLAQDWLPRLLASSELPSQAWVAWARPGLGLAAGRFASGLGAGHFGSTVQNPEAPHYDQVMFHAGNDRLRFAWMLGSSSAQLSGSEAEIQWRRADDAAYGPTYWDELNDHDSSSSQTALKLFAYHTLEFRPLERLRLGVTEMLVMGGTEPGLNWILPTLGWHSAYCPGYANSGMAFMASAVPFDGLLVSGQFFVDDTRSSDEPAYAKPNSYAWQAAASYRFIPAPGSLVSLGVEYNHVDRWTYVRWQPYLTMYQRQILTGGYRGMDLPLGFTYGPDCDQGGAWAELRTARGLRARLSYELVRKGPIYMGMVEHVDNVLTTATTAPEYIPVYYDYDKYAGEGALAAILARPDEIRNIVSGRVDAPLLANLDAVAALTLGFYRNFGNVSGAEERLVTIYLGAVWRPFEARTAGK